MVQSIQALSTVLDNHSDRLQSLEKRIDDLHSESLVNHLQFQKLTKQRIDELTIENARYREALIAISYFANKDDVNGEAGNIAEEVLKEKEQDVHELSCLIYICTCDKKVVKK